MEGNESLIPAEFGIGLNKAFMDLKNISDINVYFNDPINDIGFMSPGVISNKIIPLRISRKLLRLRQMKSI